MDDEGEYDNAYDSNNDDNAMFSDEDVKPAIKTEPVEIGEGENKAGVSGEAALGNMEDDELTKLLEASVNRAELVEKPPIDDVPFQVRNVVTSFHLGQSIDLRKLVTLTRNSEYNPNKFGALVMRIRDPRITALIHPSGKCVVTGEKDVDRAKRGAKKIAKIVATCGHPKVRLHKYSVDNMVVTTDFRHPIRLNEFINIPNIDASYEPEVFAGAVYRMVNPVATALVFCSGKVTLTGIKSAEVAQAACNRVHYTAKPVLTNA